MTINNSLAGLNAASFQLATTSNNVTNVETTGFKKSRASFESIYVSTIQQSQKIQEGQGLSNAELKRDFQQVWQSAGPGYSGQWFSASKVGNRSARDVQP